MDHGRSKWDQLAPGDQRALKEARLRRLLRDHVAPFSPFYRALFARVGLDPYSIRTLDDLRRLPFTTKQDLLPSPDNPDGPKALILQPTAEAIANNLPPIAKLRLGARALLGGKARLRGALRREYAPCTMFFTTGRSSAAIPFFLTPYDHELLSVSARRICEVVGIRADVDRIFNLFPYAPHLAFWQTFFCGLETGTLTLNSGGGRVMSAERTLGAIERLKPTVLVAMPGYFYHLLRIGAEEKRDLSSIRTVALGGENVAAGFKRKAADLLAQAGARDVKIASVLGFTESRLCWAECTGDRRSGFHTYPDLGHFEIIDPASGEPLPPGTTGELVYTCLDGRGSIVLRYRTGDIVEGGLVDEPCPGCGRTVPRIMSDIRRVSNIKSLDFGKVKGTLVNLNDLATAFAGDAEIEEWQLELRKRNDDPFETDEIVLHCSLRDDVDPETFRRRIQAAVHARGEVHLNEIRIASTAELLGLVGMEERPKEERIVDRRALAKASNGSPVP